MTDTSRIDKWLFHARFFRSRSSAQAAAAAGRVRLNGARLDKPSHALKCGDVLTLGRAGEILAVRVLALAQRRGPADVARTLYEIVDETRNSCELLSTAAASIPLPWAGTRRKHTPVSPPLEPAA